jgi:hypothetical protein
MSHTCPGLLTSPASALRPPIPTFLLVFLTLSHEQLCSIDFPPEHGGLPTCHFTKSCHLTDGETEAYWGPILALSEPYTCNLSAWEGPVYHTQGPARAGACSPALLCQHPGRGLAMPTARRNPYYPACVGVRVPTLESRPTGAACGQADRSISCSMRSAGLKRLLCAHPSTALSVSWKCASGCSEWLKAGFIQLYELCH